MGIFFTHKKGTKNPVTVFSYIYVTILQNYKLFFFFLTYLVVVKTP